MTAVDRVREEAVRTPSPVLPDAVAGLLTAVGVVLLGAPVGLLWARLAPRVAVVLTGGPPAFVDPEPAAFLDADVVFAALTLAAGVLTGFVVFALARRYGPGAVVGLLVGGLVASYVAQRTGEQVGREAFQALLDDPDARGTVEASLRLFTDELLVAWPIGALVAFAGLTALLTDDDGRAAPRTGGGLSSD